MKLDNPANHPIPGDIICMRGSMRIFLVLTKTRWIDLLERDLGYNDYPDQYKLWVLDLQSLTKREIVLHNAFGKALWHTYLDPNDPRA